MKEFDLMDCRSRFAAALIASFTLFQTTPTFAHVFDEVWETVNYEKHGFSMLMPSDSYVAAFESEPEDGWVTLRGNVEGAFFLGLVSANVEAVPPELDALRNKFGGYGVGARGSYVFLVKTSDADFATHRTDYTKWFESITLDE